MPGLPDVEDVPLLSVLTGFVVVNTIVVVAAIIKRHDRYLVTRRQAGVHLSGLWEFPGGKCDRGESLTAGMSRELREELDIRATVGAEVFAATHEYPDRRVELHFFECQSADDPSPVLGQEMRWVTAAELADLEFPPADSELIRKLVGRRADLQVRRDGPT
jgi:8-oxo-dGTP diphosphatase